jgi:hypothetical protein
MQYGQGDNYPLIEGLRIQLKCTYAHEPKANGIHYPLSKKNYDDLRRNCLYPRILIVVYVPRNVNNWLKHSDNFLSLYHSAYWVSLHGQPSKDTDTVTIRVAQEFTVEELVRIMNLIAQGKRP